MCVSVVPDGSETGKRNFGLARTQRMTRSVEIRETFDQGRRQVGRFMVLWLRRGAGANQRLGVVAGKRSIPKAFSRARAKRLLREAFRLNRWRLKGNDDVLLVARRAILSVKRQDVERELLRLAKRAGVLETESSES